MTLNLLAKLAGVSVSTVSKAFSGSADVSEETRQHIFEIAKEQGVFDRYNKNKYDKKVIGVICPEINSEYYNAIVTLLNREIDSKGGVMTVSVGNFSAEREEELFYYYSAYCKTDGIILINSQADIKNPLRVPAVALSPARKSLHIDRIHTTLKEAIEDAVKYLKQMGHTRVGFAGETLTHSKQEYFMDAMRTVGIPVHQEWIKVSGERFERAGIDIAQAWLERGDMPTAIIAAYDHIAIGMIKVLKSHGIRVPEDISVMGMDDIAVAPYLETSLTTIRGHTDESCRLAVELVMKKIDNRYYCAKEDIAVPSEFIVRGSTGNAPRIQKQGSEMGDVLSGEFEKHR